MIYKNGVYDVTSFLPSHPGGEQILNAGGLSIEPFWNVYGMHKTQEVYALLESYRIGECLYYEDNSAKSYQFVTQFTLICYAVVVLPSR